MIRAYFTQYGLEAVNRSLTDDDYRIKFAKIKLNATAHITDPIMEIDFKATDIPAPSVEGYVNKIYYDKDNHGLVIQAVVPRGQPEVYVNGFGIYDDEDNLLIIGAFPYVWRYHTFSNLNVFVFVPLFSNMEIPVDKIFINPPENYVVLQTHIFSDYAYKWIVRHALLRSDIVYKVFNENDEEIIPWRAKLNPGYLELEFEQPTKGKVVVIGYGTACTEIPSNDETENPPDLLYTQRIPEYPYEFLIKDQLLTETRLTYTLTSGNKTYFLELLKNLNNVVTFDKIEYLNLARTLIFAPTDNTEAYCIFRFEKPITGIKNVKFISKVSTEENLVYKSGIDFKAYLTDSNYEPITDPISLNAIQTVDSNVAYYGCKIATSTNWVRCYGFSLIMSDDTIYDEIPNEVY